MADQQSHTPTTGQVETGFALYLYDRENIVISSGRDRFKAWLAERDARIEAAAEQRGAIKALRDAVKEDRMYNGISFFVPEESLLDRADQMESDDE